MGEAFTEMSFNTTVTGRCTWDLLLVEERPEGVVLLNDPAEGGGEEGLRHQRQATPPRPVVLLQNGEVQVRLLLQIHSDTSVAGW